ncbi:hypothetical protein [Methylocapsa palsarum]|uniref:Lipopolysaccharide biosynthesis protein n=1 Tax=Methylocapsa palsarum TaxID=1612308 RepID=A0A1I3W8X3_9HYPH|nr:hypothetical protein [Methylocapsa palsarum]SFK03127.1 hypothetical protein SAMN05444581_101383 [Methylocapsa palsarum]
MIGLEWSEPGRERVPEAEQFGALGAAAVSLVCAFLICVVMALAPLTYRAEAELAIGAAGQDHRLLSGVYYEAGLVRSRDLARQAIKDLRIESRAEFNPSLQNPGFADRALIAMGLARDPSRVSEEERILQAFNDHLTVRAAPRARTFTIGFQSQDRAFAAEAANVIADLYLEMLAGVPADARGLEPAAHIVTRAAEPALPQVQGSLLLLSGAGTIFLAALSGFFWRGFSGVFSALEREPAPQSAFEQLRILGPTPVFARLHETARRGLIQPSLVGAARAERVAADIASRILSARPKSQGARIVASSLTAAAARPMMLAFARYLAQEDHAIVIAFDAAESAGLQPRGGQAPGLAELVSGQASFSEVIRRDPASRLHFVAAGVGDALDHQSLERILDALELTYDFVLLIAPPLDRSDLAKKLAEKAEFFVLATPPQPREGDVREARTELIERGAGEVLVIGMPSEAPPSKWDGACKDAA